MSQSDTDRFPIVHEPGARRGRFFAVLGEAEAELTYHHAGAGTVVADHTFVPPALRGRGVAVQLVEALVETARTEGWRVVAQCSYVDAAFRRNPDWGSLRA